MSTGMTGRIASPNWAMYPNQQRNDNNWLERTVLRQLSKCRSTSRMTANIPNPEELKERWNGLKNRIAKLGYVSKSAAHQRYLAGTHCSWITRQLRKHQQIELKHRYLSVAR